jgi:hypothetical protein
MHAREYSPVSLGIVQEEGIDLLVYGNLPIED